MQEILVVVDMQNDFIEGSIGSVEAMAIVPKVAEKIKNWDGEIVVTLDRHERDEETVECLRYTEHCVDNWGRSLNADIANAIVQNKGINVQGVAGIVKNTFAHICMSEYISSDVLNMKFEDARRSKDFRFEVIGLCTDICVLNACLCLRNNFPYANIEVDASCCAGSSKAAHEAALLVMKNNCIDVCNG